MDPEPAKLRFQETTQSAEQHKVEQKQATLEFGSVEELLRHDAAQVSPPPTLVERLKTSVAGESPPNRRWWRRIFNRRPPEP
ncbi:MAG: hypothetical protein ACYDH9_18305 [Limisphaerales bacterium]